MSTQDTDTDTDREVEPVESVDDTEANVLLADPDDYHQAQRLREIHRARRHVHDALRNYEAVARPNDHTEQKQQIAYAVTAYITELQPLIEHTDGAGELPDAASWDDLDHYAHTMGIYPTDADHDHAGQYAGPNASRAVFDRANRVLAEVKPLVEPDESDEWEV